MNANPHANALSLTLIIHFHHSYFSSLYTTCRFPTTLDPFPPPLHGYTWPCMVTSYLPRTYTRSRPTSSYRYSYPLSSIIPLFHVNYPSILAPKSHCMTTRNSLKASQNPSSCSLVWRCFCRSPWPCLAKMVRVSILNDALRSMYNAEKRGNWRVMIRPSSKVTVKFLMVASKHGGIGGFEYVGDHRPGKDCCWTE